MALPGFFAWFFLASDGFAWFFLCYREPRLTSSIWDESLGPDQAFEANQAITLTSSIWDESSGPDQAFKANQAITVTSSI